MKKVISGLGGILLVVVVLLFVGKSSYIPFLSELTWSSGLFPGPYDLQVEAVHSYKMGATIPEDYPSPWGDIDIGFIFHDWDRHRVQGKAGGDPYLVLGRIAGGQAEDTPRGDYLLFILIADEVPKAIGASGWKDIATYYLDHNGRVLGGIWDNPEIGPGEPYRFFHSPSDTEFVGSMRQRSDIRIHIANLEGGIWPLWPSSIR